MPSISIIIPTYQHATTIVGCLEHLFAQTLKPDEIIVVDDGSTDETATLLLPFEDRIQIIRQENAGGNLARMRGLEAATGEWILFCDADAWFVPDGLAELADSLQEHTEASYAYSGFRFGWKQFRSFPFDPARLRRMNFIHTSALIRRAHFPGFDPQLKRLQDWDVWLTMLQRGHIGIHVPRELFRIIDADGRAGISQWQPSFLYRLPWHLIGWKPRAIQSYEQAREIILRKHHLPLS
jgi:glycosyltransferase involved in cell wall biosynthesis